MFFATSGTLYHDHRILRLVIVAAALRAVKESSVLNGALATLRSAMATLRSRACQLRGP
jgi:hypothetical protein